MRLKKIIIIFTLLSMGVSYSFATPYYLWDDYGGTWYDVDKKYDGNDEYMCWAAAAINQLAWGDWIPTSSSGEYRWDVPNSDEPDLDEVFYFLKGELENTGYFVEPALEWWITGDYDDIFKEYDQYFMGGPFLEYAENVHEDIEFEGNFEDYYKNLWIVDEQDKSSNVGFLDDILHDGYATSISIHATDGKNIGWHALNVWGIEYDDHGYYAGLYLTENNDGPGDELLYTSLELTDNEWLLSDFHLLGEDWYIGDVFGLAARDSKCVPEPNSIGLIFLGILSIIAMKYRRKKF